MNVREAKRQATSAVFKILANGSPDWGAVSEDDWHKLDAAYEVIVREIGLRFGQELCGRIRTADPYSMNAPEKESDDG